MLREALSVQDLKRGLIALARVGRLVKGSSDKHRLRSAFSNQGFMIKQMVELRGIEPLTSALRTRRSPS